MYMITKVSYYFALDKANGLRKKYMLCQKDSSTPSLDPSRNRNNTVCGYANRKNNIEEFQGSEVPFPVGILVHLTILTGKNCVLLNSVQEWLLGCL